MTCQRLQRRYEPSVFSLHQKMCQVFQCARACAKRIERSAARGDQSVGSAQRLIDAVNSRIRRLFRGRILPRGLAKLSRGLRYIEHVIDDLESQSNRASEVPQSLDLDRRASGEDTPGDQAGSDQGS